MVQFRAAVTVTISCNYREFRDHVSEYYSLRTLLHVSSYIPQSRILYISHYGHCIFFFQLT
jgi:hypothetical protein